MYFLILTIACNTMTDPHFEPGFRNSDSI